ncbi:MAG: hypothetical protein AYP45_17500 [Candidatus Brocadia carolinensis]|uniref:Uncharacterized protein n=1 Tax=Candidatus Brocadia carolinensis TaxID=1004156 RepID=A0A1V4API3_9BACT|nr:MAG: hypothetical protein AYP45_17500 [Candidatus Brocadia caroliniensis]
MWRSVVITREGIASEKTLAMTLAMPSLRYSIMYTPPYLLFLRGKTGLRFLFNTLLSLFTMVVYEE